MLAHWIVWVKVCAFRWLLVTDSSRLTVFASSWFCRARLCVSVCFGSVEDAVCYLIADLATLIKLSLEALLPETACACVCKVMCVFMCLWLYVFSESALWFCFSSPLLLLLAVFPQAVTLRKQEAHVCVCTPECFACFSNSRVGMRFASSYCFVKVSKTLIRVRG